MTKNVARHVAQFALQKEDIHGIDQQIETEDSSDKLEKILLGNCRQSYAFDVANECDIGYYFR
jgi:hypothetical protein